MKPFLKDVKKARVARKGHGGPKKGRADRPSKPVQLIP